VVFGIKVELNDGVLVLQKSRQLAKKLDVIGRKMSAISRLWRYPETDTAAA
jgi:hypothetical protein